MSKTHELILQMPPDTPLIRHARSTVLLASVESIHAAGYGEAYLRALEEPHRQTIVNSVAGSWMPLDVALAHYRACDALALSPDKQTDIGRGTGERTRGILLGTVIRMAKGAGVTPWTLLPHYQRFWDRGYDGGGMTIYKIGPKEARIDLARCPLVTSRYFRSALRGVSMTLLDLFCSKSFMTEMPGPRTDLAVSYRVQWA